MQLEKVNKFIAEQKEMEARLEEQAKQIEADAANHAHVISELERKHVQVGGCFTLVPFCHSTEVPTPRCSGEGPAQKEMLLKLRETKANLLKMTDNQLDTTTKRTCVASNNTDGSPQNDYLVAAALQNR